MTANRRGFFAGSISAATLAGAAIAKGRPLIKDIGPYFETEPVGGVGL